METAIVLFTRDLRVHDQPALAAAVREARRLVPLFVLEDVLVDRSSERARFLTESLHDLDQSLRARGANLVVRRGDTASVVAGLARETHASAVFVSIDASARAQRRERALASIPGLALRLLDGNAIVESGLVAPAGRDHYRVFGPYCRAWQEAPRRASEPAPGRIAMVEGVDPGPLLPLAGRASDWPGGESEGRRRAERWLAGGARSYATTRDFPAMDGTSRLSPYLRFGCLSATELAEWAGPGEFLRQLCWRDFAFQLLRANPDSEHRDLSPTGAAWDADAEALDAWRAGLTGYPLVDAGMRQLAREGWMHNRVRMVVASFLTKHLTVDWREGARHFDRLLVDGDPANNTFGWQWVAGTGVDTRPGRMFNPTLQGRRFDPEATYVRRYVPELAGLSADVIHEPWKLAGTLEAPEYPPPIVDHAAAFAAYRDRLAAARARRPS